MKGKLIIVSNRLPLTVTKEGGVLRFSPSAGGLATGLSSFVEKHNISKSLWIGWPGIHRERLNNEEKAKIKKKLSEHSSYPVFLLQSEIKGYYNEFSNRTIWPLFHYFPLYATYSSDAWNTYKKVNKLFCQTVMENYKEGDIIWVQDYHLMLLPMLIRKEIPEASIGFFLHIPFPSSEVFRLIPWRKEILEGILGSDLVGFHIYTYVDNFLSSVRRLLGYENNLGQISVGNRLVKVDIFPMGIDFEKYTNAIHQPAVKREILRFSKSIGERKIILSVDRLDYTKGILERVEAFRIFLEKYPKYRREVTLILIAVPSRTKVENYRTLKEELDRAIGMVNGRFSTVDWIPIMYFYRFFDFHSLAALYTISDVAMVTPIRDGMNLVAKEFIATKSDERGVLILSETAGASMEMSKAIIVNPNDKDGIVNAIKEALEMPEAEKRKRNSQMRERLKNYDVVRWAEDFLVNLLRMKRAQKRIESRKLSRRIREKLIEDYKNAKKRLLFLDYDGTLVPFSERPELASPDKEILSLLKNLSCNKKNELVIISGRHRDTLKKWLGGINLSLVGEHGVWMKIGDEEKDLSELVSDEWKPNVKPMLKRYVDITPGSFIEEKKYSLAWHYRTADPELGERRANELKNNLVNLLANMDLQVLDGSKVLEIKSGSINKGVAAKRWLSSNQWDFIMAIGDDWTDEDIFSVLPGPAYSIKVGIGASRSKFYVDSTSEVRKLLKSLIDAEVNKHEDRE